MTGPELKAIRHRLGLSTVEMGRAIGYEGQDNTLSVAVRKYESGGRPIPPWIANLVRMYGLHGLPPTKAS
jgi:transcriptional regulator with XRE-family HTH domain